MAKKGFWETAWDETVGRVADFLDGEDEETAPPPPRQSSSATRVDDAVTDAAERQRIRREQMERQAQENIERQQEQQVQRQQQQAERQRQQQEANRVREAENQQQRAEEERINRQVAEADARAQANRQAAQSQQDEDDEADRILGLPTSSRTPEPVEQEVEEEPTNLWQRALKLFTGEDEEEEEEPSPTSGTDQWANNILGLPDEEEQDRPALPKTGQYSGPKVPIGAETEAEDYLAGWDAKEPLPKSANPFDRFMDWWHDSGAYQAEIKVERPRGMASDDMNVAAIQKRIDEGNQRMLETRKRIATETNPQQRKDAETGLLAETAHNQWLQFRLDHPNSTNWVAEWGTHLRNFTMPAWYTLGTVVNTEPIREGGTTPAMFYGGAQTATMEQLEASGAGVNVEGAQNKLNRAVSAPVMFLANTTSALMDYYAPGLSTPYTVSALGGNLVVVGDTPGKKYMVNGVPTQSIGNVSRPVEYVEGLLALANEVNAMDEGPEKDIAKLTFPGMASGYDHVQNRINMLTNMDGMIADYTQKAQAAQAQGNAQLAAQYGAEIESLRAMTLQDVIDTTTDPVMDLLQGLILDPLNLLDGPIDEIARLVRAGNLARQVPRAFGTLTGMTAKGDWIVESIQAGAELMSGADAAAGMNAYRNVITGKSLLGRASDVPVLGKITDLFAPTREAMVRKVTRDAFRQMANMIAPFRSISIHDVNVLLDALVNSPASLMTGLDINLFDTPSIRNQFALTGKVQFGENLIASKDMMLIYPVLQQAGIDLKNIPYLKVPTPAEGVAVPGALAALNKPGFLAAYQAAIDDAASRMFGINSIRKMNAEIPVGSVSFHTRAASRREAMGVEDLVVVEYRNRHGDKLGQSEIMHKAAAEEFAAEAGRLANAPEGQFGSRTVGWVGDIQRSVMNVTYLGMPRNWIRNAANAYAGMILDGAMQIRSTSQDADMLMKKMGIGFGDERVLAAFEGGGGVPGAVAPVRGSRARGTGNFWQRLSDLANKIPYSNTAAFGGRMPIGEQRFFSRIYASIFEKTFNRGIKQAINEHITKYLLANGVDRKTAKSITNILYEVAKSKDKEAFMVKLRELLFGGYVPRPLADLGIDPDLISAEGLSRMMDVRARIVYPEAPEPPVPPVGPDGAPTPPPPPRRPRPAPPGGAYTPEEGIAEIEKIFFEELIPRVRTYLASGVSPGAMTGILKDIDWDTADLEGMLLAAARAGKLPVEDAKRISNSFYFANHNAIKSLVGNLQIQGMVPEAREIVIGVGGTMADYQFKFRNDIDAVRRTWKQNRRGVEKDILTQTYAQEFQEYLEVTEEYNAKVTALINKAHGALSNPELAADFLDEPTIRSKLVRKTTKMTPAEMQEWLPRYAYNVRKDVVDAEGKRIPQDVWNQNVINAQTQNRDMALSRLWNAFVANPDGYALEQFLAAETMVMRHTISAATLAQDIYDEVFGGWLRDLPRTKETAAIRMHTNNRVGAMEKRVAQAQANIYDAAAEAILKHTTTVTTYTAKDGVVYQYLGPTVDGKSFEIRNTNTGDVTTVAPTAPNAPPPAVQKTVGEALIKKNRPARKTPAATAGPQPATAAPTAPVPPVGQAHTPEIGDRYEVAGFTKKGTTRVNVKGVYPDGVVVGVGTEKGVSDQFLSFDELGTNWVEETSTAASTPGNVTGFTTSKGSTYVVNPDGSTTRNKSFHPEHGAADVGLKPPSAVTFYMPEDVATPLGASMDYWTHMGVDPATNTVFQGRINNGGKFVRTAGYPYSPVPTVGQIPVELWGEDTGKGAAQGWKVYKQPNRHFGNEIVSVETGGAPEAAAPNVRTGKAMWRNASHDEPVTVTGSMGIGPDGRQYMSTAEFSGGTPYDELVWDEAAPTAALAAAPSTPAAAPVTPAAPAPEKVREKPGPKPKPKPPEPATPSVPTTPLKVGEPRPADTGRGYTHPTTKYRVIVTDDGRHFQTNNYTAYTPKGKTQPPLVNGEGWIESPGRAWDFKDIPDPVDMDDPIAAAAAAVNEVPLTPEEVKELQDLADKTAAVGTKTKQQINKIKQVIGTLSPEEQEEANALLRVLEGEASTGSQTLRETNNKLPAVTEEAAPLKAKVLGITRGGKKLLPSEYAAEVGIKVPKKKAPAKATYSISVDPPDGYLGYGTEVDSVNHGRVTIEGYTKYGKDSNQTPNYVFYDPVRNKWAQITPTNIGTPVDEVEAAVDAISPTAPPTQAQEAVTTAVETATAAEMDEVVPLAGETPPPPANAQPLTPDRSYGTSSKYFQEHPKTAPAMPHNGYFETALGDVLIDPPSPQVAMSNVTYVENPARGEPVTMPFSKARDGQPITLQVWRGTGGKNVHYLSGKGVYLTGSKQVAQGYGPTVTRYAVTVNNPKVVKFTDAIDAQAKKWAKENGLSDYLRQRNGESADGEALRIYLQVRGYDSLLATESKLVVVYPKPVQAGETVSTASVPPVGQETGIPLVEPKPQTVRRVETGKTAKKSKNFGKVMVPSPGPDGHTAANKDYYVKGTTLRRIKKITDNGFNQPIFEFFEGMPPVLGYENLGKWVDMGTGTKVPAREPTVPRKVAESALTPERAVDEIRQPEVRTAPGDTPGERLANKAKAAGKPIYKGDMYGEVYVLKEMPAYKSGNRVNKVRASAVSTDGKHTFSDVNLEDLGTPIGKGEGPAPIDRTAEVTTSVLAGEKIKRTLAEPGVLAVLDKRYARTIRDTLQPWIEKNWQELNTPGGLPVPGHNRDYAKGFLRRNGYDARIDKSTGNLYVINSKRAANDLEQADTSGGGKPVVRYVAPSFDPPVEFNLEVWQDATKYINDNWEALTTTGMKTIPANVRDVLAHSGFDVTKPVRRGDDMRRVILPPDEVGALKFAQQSNLSGGSKRPKHRLKYDMTRREFRDKFGHAFDLPDDFMDDAMAATDSVAGYVATLWNRAHPDATDAERWTPENYYARRFDRIVESEGVEDAVARVLMIMNREGEGLPYIIESFVHALKKAGSKDVSTVAKRGRAAMEELSHVWIETIYDFQDEIPEFKNDVKILDAWLDTLSDDFWERKEILAKALLQNMATGETPHPALKGVFARFKDWFKGLLNNMMSDIMGRTRNPQAVRVLPEDVRDVFTRVFGEPPVEWGDLSREVRAAEDPSSVAPAQWKLDRANFDEPGWWEKYDAPPPWMSDTPQAEWESYKALLAAHDDEYGWIKGMRGEGTTETPKSMRGWDTLKPEDLDDEMRDFYFDEFGEYRTDPEGVPYLEKDWEEMGGFDQEFLDSLANSDKVRNVIDKMPPEERQRYLNMFTDGWDMEVAPDGSLWVSPPDFKREGWVGGVQWKTPMALPWVEQESTDVAKSLRELRQMRTDTANQLIDFRLDHPGQLDEDGLEIVQMYEETLEEIDKVIKQVREGGGPRSAEKPPPPKMQSMEDIAKLPELDQLIYNLRRRTDSRFRAKYKLPDGPVTYDEWEAVIDRLGMDAETASMRGYGFVEGKSMDELEAIWRAGPTQMPAPREDKVGWRSVLKNMTENMKAAGATTQDIIDLEKTIGIDQYWSSVDGLSDEEMYSKLAEHFGGDWYDNEAEWKQWAGWHDQDNAQRVNQTFDKERRLLGNEAPERLERLDRNSEHLRRNREEGVPLPQEFWEKTDSRGKALITDNPYEDYAGQPEMQRLWLNQKIEEIDHGIYTITEALDDEDMANFGIAPDEVERLTARRAEMEQLLDELDFSQGGDSLVQLRRDRIDQMRRLGDTIAREGRYSENAMSLEAVLDYMDAEIERLQSGGQARNVFDDAANEVPGDLDEGGEPFPYIPPPGMEWKDISGTDDAGRVWGVDPAQQERFRRVEEYMNAATPEEAEAFGITDEEWAEYSQAHGMDDIELDETDQKIWDEETRRMEEGDDEVGALEFASRRRLPKNRGNRSFYDSLHNKGETPLSPRPITDTGDVGAVPTPNLTRDRFGASRPSDEQRMRMMAKGVQGTDRTRLVPDVHSTIKPDVYAEQMRRGSLPKVGAERRPISGTTPTSGGVSTRGNTIPASIGPNDAHPNVAIPKGTGWNAWRTNQDQLRQNPKWIDAWYWYLTDNLSASTGADTTIIGKAASDFMVKMQEWGHPVPKVKSSALEFGPQSRGATRNVTGVAPAEADPVSAAAAAVAADPHAGEAERVAGFAGEEWTGKDRADLWEATSKRADTDAGSGAPELGEMAGKAITDLHSARAAVIADIMSPTGGTGGGGYSGGTLPPGVAEGLMANVGRMGQDYDNAVDFASRMAGNTARFTMLEPSNTRGFDNILRMVMPYHYFWSRSAMNWMRRGIENPAMWNLYQETQRAIDMQENRQEMNDMPLRGQGRQAVGQGYYISNPLDIFLPYNSYLGNELVDVEGANNEFERNWLLAKRHTPLGGPIIDAAVAGYLDLNNPLPQGTASRLSQYGLADIAPQVRWGELPYQMLTGKIAPTWISGDPYMLGLAGRQVAASQTPAGESPQEYEALREWAMDVGYQIMNKVGALPEQPERAQQIWDQAVYDSGFDKLTGQFLGMMLGLSFVRIRPEEMDARHIQAARRAAGYGGGENPFGSRAAIDALDKEVGKRHVSLAQYSQFYPQSQPPDPMAEDYGRPGAGASKAQRRLALDEARTAWEGQRDAFIEANLGVMETDEIYNQIYGDEVPGTIAAEYAAKKAQINEEYPSAELVPAYDLSPEYFMEMNPQELQTYAFDKAADAADGEVAELKAQQEQARLAKDWDTFYALKEQIPLAEIRALEKMLQDPQLLASFTAGVAVQPLSLQEAQARAEELVTDLSWRSKAEQALADYSASESSGGGGGSGSGGGAAWVDDEGNEHSATGAQIREWWDEYHEFTTKAEKVAYLQANPDFADYYANWQKEKYGETDRWWENGANGYVDTTSGGTARSFSAPIGYIPQNFSDAGRTYASNGGGFGMGGGTGTGGTGTGTGTGGKQSSLLPYISDYAVAPDVKYPQAFRPSQDDVSLQDPYRMPQAAEVGNVEGVENPYARPMPDWQAAIARLRA